MPQRVSATWPLVRYIVDPSGTLAQAKLENSEGKKNGNEIYTTGMKTKSQLLFR